jgi:hypothetical protein
MIFFKITLGCLLAIGIFNFANTLVDLNIRSSVYACSDKEENPTEIQIQCKRLTKGQWWNK